jgi:hypothetical protein
MVNKQIDTEEGINLRIFEAVTRLKRDVDELYDELEIVKNKKMVKSVERSRKEMRDGKLYDWDEFKKLVDDE